MNELLDQVNVLIKDNPDARIVTDIDASSISGYSALSSVEFLTSEDGKKFIVLGFIIYR